MKKILAAFLIPVLVSLPSTAMAQWQIGHRSFYHAASAGNTITFVEAVGNTTAGTTASYNVTVTSTSTNDALFIGVWDQTSTLSCAAGTAQPTISFNQTATATLQTQTASTINNTHTCLYLYSLLNTPSAITTVTTQQGSGDTSGGTVVLHFSSSGAWTGIDQNQTITTTSQGTPWASAGVTTTQTHEVLIGIVGMTITTYNSGIQNAIAPTGSWTDYAICAVTTAPCLTTANSGANLDAGNGDLLGLGYQIVTSTQTGIAFTGTNNSSTNVYANYPDITTYY